MIEVDGSYGEGGGQVLRTAVALAAVLSKEIHVFNIRAGRAEPGIRPQHMTGVKAAAQLCSADLSGLEVGSTEFVFKPGKLRAGTFRFDVGTAGSVTLVLQTLMPILAFAPGPVQLEIAGGTDVKWSPPIDYLRFVTLPILKKVGYHAELELIRRGHYPKGGGLVKFSTGGASKLQAMIYEKPGSISNIYGMSHAVALPRHVAERQAAAAGKNLEEAKLPSASIDVEVANYGRQLSPGSGIVLSAETQNRNILGSDALGERGRPAEEVGSTAGRILVEEVESGAMLDRHMGDMMIPYLLLAKGASEVSVSRVTQHARTNVKVAEWLTGGRLELQGEIDQPGRLRVEGQGSM
ncbi:MAG: RNA 3'-terminal-phosphate cyclase [Crenarchaeota archaeon 13_1_40CM_2_52_14]|nr:MAG: RNA 3'-terminal-phosphate cyclase [Crenarchaeota archaeon 13_1_40CM_3_52_17]OLD34163.1 MAG: RNA 3'-terminal-phosphate cyclase [Crenarchaeota archaeon 13_1_40CM_2_52_14]